jgi:hypothetical protein
MEMGKHFPPEVIAAVVTLSDEFIFDFTERERLVINSAPIYASDLCGAANNRKTLASLTLLPGARRYGAVWKSGKNQQRKRKVT